MLQPAKNTFVFSIIIPTFNRPDALFTCLEHVARLGYPTSGFEVIVVDDGSDFCLDGVVKVWKNRLNLTVLRQENSGPATARNTGARHARGTYLAFVDDDCMPDKTWLTRLEARLKKNPDALVGGKTVNTLTSNLFAQASQQIVTFLYGYFQTCQSIMPFFTANNMVVPARKFRDMGGFNTTFPMAAAEDREFCSHWLFSGGAMAYEPEAVMGHAHLLTLTSYFRQHFNYGRGGFLYNRIQKQRRGMPLKIAPLSFYTALLLFPKTGQGHPIKKGLISVLIFLSQFATFLGFFYEGHRQKGVI